MNYNIQLLFHHALFKSTRIDNLVMGVVHLLGYNLLCGAHVLLSRAMCC